jgi:hypothetical protein
LLVLRRTDKERDACSDGAAKLYSITAWCWVLSRSTNH